MEEAKSSSTTHRTIELTETHTRHAPIQPSIAYMQHAISDHHASNHTSATHTWVQARALRF